ncbi:PREDICTED: AT-rich interactive domain-containing protein 5B isoform X2 [Nanorana parkeri]|uniref:AT-rich interactive domain-containing protein 5B isoform X2 n=1 Tax=Nanorana parkeri TaxID=125878 RepID=UPI0008546B04|nr:PREDICTED: AT-rich interactive domain-containing protein 5B isoform X2 [Nanorana parkeri]
MEPNSLKWVGSPCGLHGPYIFYKAFQFHLEDKPRILSLGDFFLVRCKPEEPICIAELQLLWEERISRQLLSSSKLYFLPEDTPLGRNSDHGEDEVIAVSEKVIVKLEDIVKWAHLDFSKWKCGLRALPIKLKELGKNGQKECILKYRQSILNSGLNFKDVFKEKSELGEDENEGNVMVLSYPQYCRYRSILKRIQAKPSSVLAEHFVQALGGIPIINKNTKILYCRDTFDHPTLIDNESICDEFAPNLKGRPRKKKQCPQRRDSVNGVKDASNICEGKTVAKVKCEVKTSLPKARTANGNCKKIPIEEKPKSPVEDGCKNEECKADEQAFLVALYKYMKERKTPIERIPYLGFKQINLWTMFQAAQKLGGYETITARRQWKHIYDELGGNPGSTSAATCTRRHYERLILPYERFLKGEEDKPLPPVKPRKPDANFPEAEAKTKMCSKKGVRHEGPKTKKERDAAAKAEEAEASSVEENHLDDDEKEVSVVYDSEETKPSVECSDLTEEKEQVQESIPDTCHVKNEDKMCSEPVPADSFTHLVKEINSSLADEQPQMTIENSTIIKQEQSKQEFSDPSERDVREGHFNMFPTVQLQVPHENHIEDERLLDMPDYIANCTVKVDPLSSEDLKNPLDSNILQNALKQNPKVYLVQSLDVLKEKDNLSSSSEESSFTYTPLLYSRGNPGIMSPLAKKKLLSQVSGAVQSGSYPYGSPPPLISKKKLNSKTEISPPLVQTHSASNSEPILVNRPSVIQHVQSFKHKTSDDKKNLLDPYKISTINKADSYRSEFAKHQQSVLAESYSLKSSMLEHKEQMAEKRAAQHSSFLEFYSSPHLHRLYRQTEHHLHNEHPSKYHSRELYRESENMSSPHKHQEKLHYHHSLHQQEKQNVPDHMDDQPTDLSLPKSMHKHTAKISGSNLSHQLVQQESKSPFHVPNNKHMGIDCNPKACRVSPMTIPISKRHHESVHRSIKTHSARHDNVRKMEGLVHPITVGKVSPQNFGTLRPLKRSLDDLEGPVSEKKIRAVSPLNVTKEIPGKEIFTGQEGESSKSIHDIHSSSMMESHKYPLSTPIFPGLYPASLCGGLGTHIPTAYSHPLQYLKNQSVLSPLMQPLALHSLMMQRQYLTNSTNSQQLYRHLASAGPVGSSYGDLLHNGIYPLTAINPQSSFPSSQLSSVHPSTKL